MIGIVPPAINSQPVTQPTPVSNPQPQPVVRRVAPPTNMTAPAIPTNDLPIMIDGIPIDIMQYFNIDMRRIDNRDKEQLNDIYNLLKNDSESISDVVLKISELERRLGAPHYDEKRWGKMHSYLRIQSRINDLEKQKQAFENGQ